MDTAAFSGQNRLNLMRHRTDIIVNHKIIVLENLKENIKRMPTIELKQEWIPCEERLPEEREWIGTKQFGTTISDIVLITFDVHGEKFVKPMSLQNGELSRADKKTMDAFYKDWNMLAWMPLPEPYHSGEVTEMARQTDCAWR